MKPDGKRGGGAAHIGGVLSQLLKTVRPEADRGMLEVWRIWDRVVGPDTARNARPAAFKGAVLLVHVTSSTWLHHLRFQKSDLMVRLNRELGREAVADLKFKVGSF